MRGRIKYLFLRWVVSRFLVDIGNNSLVQREVLRRQMYAVWVVSGEKMKLLEFESIHCSQRRVSRWHDVVGRFEVEISKRFDGWI